MDEKTLLRLAKTHGTPLVVVDHKVVAGELRAVPQAPAARAGLLRRQGQQRSGDRADVLRGGRELRRRQRGRVPDRAREREGPAGRAAAGLHLGSHHLRESHQGERNARAARSVQAARDLRQPRGSDQDRPARAARGLVLRLGCPTRGRWWSCRASSGRCPARRWT